MTEVRNRDMHFQSKNRTIEIWHRKGELMLPKDPVMLLSFVNMKLRDFYTSLDALCEEMDADRQGIVEKLAGIGYRYDEDRNQFV
jgi:hypothetical protein